ncbi:hypothetical protein GW17_00027219 [Ensete ventricosum]|uniref:Uncharacterized protein n=1 Tax=Ensete ventricosum TaxID=4639 RepID=A0A444EFW1_ENSVE|nr:hypothetical protein B296_00035764 [Ensete ventricosum]RWW09296.1 hypothetical protein GW17_00027219 [Ensete ventricosum]
MLPSYFRFLNCFFCWAQRSSDGAKKNERKQRKRDVEEENPEDFMDPVTPVGEKKQLSRQMAKQYNPSAVEKS